MSETASEESNSTAERTPQSEDNQISKANEEQKNELASDLKKETNTVAHIAQVTENQGLIEVKQSNNKKETEEMVLNEITENEKDTNEAVEKPKGSENNRIVNKAIIPNDEDAASSIEEKNESVDNIETDKTDIKSEINKEIIVKENDNNYEDDIKDEFKIMAVEVKPNHGEKNEEDVNNEKINEINVENDNDDKKKENKNKVEKENTTESEKKVDVVKEMNEKKLIDTENVEETVSVTKSKSTTSNPDEYAEHITYTEDGSAIYTDPKTKHKYKWSAEENNWVGLIVSSNDSGNGDNLYENEHYKWSTEKNEWIPKTQIATETTTSQTETEHYKWDAAKHAWIPKVQTPQVAAAAAAVEQATTANQEGKREDVTYGLDEDGQRIYTDRDGAVFFWDTKKNAWFPRIDDDFMARYQMNYGFIDNTTASEVEREQKEQAEEKRKAAELQQMAEEARAATEATAAGVEVGGGGGAGAVGGKRKAVQEPPTWFELNPEQNTKVYVSNLPLDITLDEFAEVMSKCGMIMRDPQTQKQKLKLYTESDGQIKGDGLCDYIKVESVELALNILDDYEVRGHKIHVQRAKFQMRGEYNPALKPKRKKKDKEKLQKMKEKLFDWRPEKMRGERSKNEKIVILKNLFEPELFEKEVQLILDYQNDLREECGKCGTVRKVVIYDLHPEGVAQVNMASPEEADLVIQMMQGRFFGKRQLSAEHWDGKTKYKIAETETAVKSRLTNWDQYLDDEEKKTTESSATQPEKTTTD